jgi:hypothetical protein
MESEYVTLAEGLEFLSGLAWAVFYGLTVGIGGTLLFIIALQRRDDE